jgi:hypothetical protein
MAELAIRVEAGSSRIVRLAALACDQVVVTETPVDEGTARSNWLAAVDASRSDTVEAHVPGEKGSTGAQNAEAAIAAAAGVIGRYDGAVNHAIHLTNNLPYIGELNAGSSVQAPANFVRQGVQAAVAAVEGARILDDG